MKPDDPAFPLGRIYDSDGALACWEQSGMSLRAYFAAKAMQALISKSPFGDMRHGTYDPELAETTASSACDYADALISELNK